MPGGRPTKYKREYCEQVVSFFKEGGDLTEFAVSIGVVKQTVYDWEKAHPEFMDALTRARECGEAYWKQRLRTELMLSKDVNAPLVKLYFANRFNMHDKQDVNHGGQKNNPVAVQPIQFVAEKND